MRLVKLLFNGLFFLKDRRKFEVLVLGLVWHVGTVGPENTQELHHHSIRRGSSPGIIQYFFHCSCHKHVDCNDDEFLSEGRGKLNQ